MTNAPTKPVVTQADWLCICGTWNAPEGKICQWCDAERVFSEARPASQAVVSQDLVEQNALESWAFNVMLECNGRSEDELQVAIGGAILDLRDLNAILERALRTPSQHQESE